MSKARNMARMGQDTSAGYTGAFDMPAGSSAERPANAGLGWTRLNTDTGSVEVYDGTNWNAVTRPFIASVTGTIYAGVTSNLVIAGQNFTGTITVRFLEGGSIVADVTGVSVSAGSATVAVPAAVYGQTAGDSIEVKIVNSDGTISSNGITKTVQGLPTGGTLVTSGGYRYHTFTSSSSFVVPSGFSASAEYLVVAGGGGGGGGGGNGGGGGGAGGLIGGSTTLSAQTYSVTVGAGGAVYGYNGANSVLGALATAIGGGGGGATGSQTTTGATGGSGGGAGRDKNVADGGAGTAGQGNKGGGSGVTCASAGGGGGATQAGFFGQYDCSTDRTPRASEGGDGSSSYSAWGIATSTGQDVSGTRWFAGGGGGAFETSTDGGRLAPGGKGGGGKGGGSSGTIAGIGQPGTANTGGGGGGTQGGTPLGSGGSGIVIVRYLLPT